MLLAAMLISIPRGSPAAMLISIPQNVLTHLSLHLDVRRSPYKGRNRETLTRTSSRRVSLFPPLHDPLNFNLKYIIAKKKRVAI